MSGHKTCEPKDRKLNFNLLLKTAKIIGFATDSTYWSSLQGLTPFLELVNYIATFLECATAPVLYSSLSFALLHDSLENFHLIIAIIRAANNALVYRYNTIKSDLHCFSVVLDSMVQRVCSIALKTFLFENGFSVSARKEFFKCYYWM